MSLLLRRFWLTLRTVFTRRRLDREMQEEMETHLARATERFKAGGLNVEEARRAARREFGNLDYLQEASRDARGTRWIESFLADLRYGIRHFGRTPFTTLTLIVLLALGIGANSALFTVLHSLATMPPPGIPRNESLVRIRGLEQSKDFGRAIDREFSYPEYLEYAGLRDMFRAVAATASTEPVLDFGPEQGVHTGSATYVTDNYFGVLGVAPVLGAGLPSLATSEGDPAVAVIGHVLWDRHFGRSTDVLGKTFKVNDVTITVVGVAPPRLAGVWNDGSDLHIWLPLQARARLEQSSAAALASHDSAFLRLVARLQPGVTAERTSSAIRTIAARAQYAGTDPGATGAFSSDVVPLLPNNLRGGSGDSLSETAMLGVITLLILILTCTNVSTILVGLAAARRREIAVRLSLGAARSRIVRQLISETVLLAFCSAGLGLLVILIVLRTFDTRFPDVQIALQWPAIASTFVLALGTGFLFGTSPALHATRLALSDVLKDAAPPVVARRSWLQPALVIVQIAFTQPMLVGLGALLLIVVSSAAPHPSEGLNERILSVSFRAFSGTASIDERRETMRRLEERLEALPGVVGVVAQRDGHGITEVVVDSADRVTGVEDVGRFRMELHAAPPGYFDLRAIPFVRGRDFVSADVHDGDRIVIGSDLARRLWGPADPIGRKLISTRVRNPTIYEVVGVIDEDHVGRSDAGSAAFSAYVPDVRFATAFLIRTHGPAGAMVAQIRSLAQAEAPQMPVASALTLAAEKDRERAQRLQMSGAAAGGGLLALFLSAIGLYAVIAFAVGQRIREIGVRTALGASGRQIIGLFFGRGMKLGVAGLLLGLPLSIVALRFLTVLWELPRANTPALTVMIAALVLSVAALATWVPARAAARVDPLESLRAE